MNQGKLSTVHADGEGRLQCGEQMDIVRMEHVQHSPIVVCISLKILRRIKAVNGRIELNITMWTIMTMDGGRVKLFAPAIPVSAPLVTLIHFINQFLNMLAKDLQRAPMAPVQPILEVQEKYTTNW